MNQESFEKQHGVFWDRFTDLLGNLEKKSSMMEPERVQAFPREYRQLCKHLALARDRRYNAYLVDRLNRLVQRAHQVLYKPRTAGKAGMMRFILVGMPQAVRAEARLFWFASALFYLPFFGSMLAVALNPELIYSLMEPAQVRRFEEMYREALGEGRTASTDVAMFGHYIWNNIGIGYRTFASGFFFGLGSFFFLIFNGVYLGAVFGYMVNMDFNQNFYAFVIGHGSLELTGIVLGGVAGLRLGLALISPGNLSRKHALAVAGRTAIPIVFSMTILLLSAAFVEAFWSPRDMNYTLKYVVGSLGWVLVFLYFMFMGRGHED